MYLFDRKKDLILKITNLVLCLWLIASVTILYVNILDYFMEEPEMTYEQYKALNCYYGKEIDDEVDFCESQYQNYLSYSKTDDFNKKKKLFISFGSVAIVSGTLYFLNKRKGDDK